MDIKNIDQRDECFSSLYPITLNDLDSVSKLYARAFFQNPMYVLLFPNEILRKKKLRYLFRYTIRYGIEYGFVYASSSALEGAAVWLPNHFLTETFSRRLKTGAYSLIFTLGIAFLKRASQLSSVVNPAHQKAEKTMPLGHLYLSPLCVDPIKQGQGIASRLIRPMLEYSEKHHIPLYLETAKEANIPMYLHFGFTDAIQTPIPNSTFINHGMIYFPSTD